MSRVQIAVVAIVAGASLIVVVAAVVVLLALRSPVAVVPDPTATAGREPTVEPTLEPTEEPAPEPTEEPTPEPSVDVQAEFATIAEQVLQLRGLPRADVPTEIISRAELEADLVAIFEEDYPEEEQAEDNATLLAMGLLEPGQDIGDLQLQLLNAGVLGYYDEDEDAIFVVSDAGLDREARTTYAHEYTHALQDAAFNLTEFDLDVEGDDDAAMARLSLIEGDAELTALLWTIDQLDADIPDGGGGTVPDLSEIPRWLIESIIFPYTVGVDFVVTLYVEDGYDAIDAAYADPPESTEQIIHPELYFADEQPVDVTLPDLAASLGDGWQLVESTPLGEATIRINLDALGTDTGDAYDAAEGWAGDELAVATAPNGSFALAWRLAWDTPADADEFARLYSREVLPALDFPGALLQLDRNVVIVGHASDRTILDAVMETARQGS